MKKRKTIIALGVALTSFLLFFNLASAEWNLSYISGFGLPKATITDIIIGIAGWILMLFSIISVGSFMVSGIMYLVSTGNDDMITKAKKYMLYSIVGVIVGLSGYVIIQAVNLMLEGSYAF